MTNAKRLNLNRRRLDDRRRALYRSITSRRRAMPPVFKDVAEEIRRAREG